jgi:hypothetical protein
VKANHKRPRTLPLGVYSDASCRAEDRIDALLPELERLHLLKADRAAVRKLAAEYNALPTSDGPMSALDDEQAEQADGILEELIQVAENYLPEFCLLGNAEGDGACFGVWADVESALQAVKDGEIWQSCARGDGYNKPGTIRLDVPRGDLYLVISDHGNVSLYRSIGQGKSREIWGVV